MLDDEHHPPMYLFLRRHASSYSCSMLQDDAGDPAEEEKNQDGPLIMAPENFPPSPSSEKACGCLESWNRWSSR